MGVDMKNKPDFIIVGAAKSGTTTLYRHLQNHSQVYLPNFKEPHFFSSNHPLNFEHISNREEYYSLFHGSDDKLCGEASTAYLYFEDAPQKIHAELPNCKIIAILRDPTERALSMWGHQVREGLENRSLEQALDEELNEGIRNRDGVEYGFNYHKLGYVSHIINDYISLFGKENVLLVDYQVLRESPENLMLSVCQFLNIDPEPLASNKERFNASGNPQNALLHQFLNSKHPLRKLLVAPLKMVLPKHKRHAIWQNLRNRNILKGKRHRMLSSTKTLLDKRFKDEVKNIKCLLEAQR